MEYLDKLKVVGDNVRNALVRGMVDTVYTVQNGVREVLPGNPLFRDYEIIRQVGSAGPCGVWRIYEAKKKSTKQAASVVLLEKRVFNKYGKQVKDDLIDKFRRGVQQLTRMKHPRLLSVQQQMEESRDSIAFAVEPVTGSLANLLKGEIDPEPLSDIEIRYGILQLCDALKFLHGEGKILHRNVCPDSIFISAESGSWKLGCFEYFIQGVLDPGKSEPRFEFPNCETVAVEFANPNFNYTAIEYIDGKAVPSFQSDMFSVGSLMYTLYNRGKMIFDSAQSRKIMHHIIRQVKSSLNMSSAKEIPAVAKNAIEILLSTDPRSRPTAVEFLKSPYFDEVCIKTLEYLDSLFQVDNLQRSMFYKTLAPLIPGLPMRINQRRLMSAFAVEFNNADMLPFILPNIFLIAERSTEKDYDKYVLPKLKQVFRLTLNVQTLAVVMKNMQMLLKKTNASDVKDYILPVVYNALDTQSQPVQDMCLQIIPSFANLIDGSSMRSAILPRIKRICIQTSTLSVRVNCLLCIGRLVEKFDKWMIVDDVIPILMAIPSREPAVLMTILGVVKVALSTRDGIPKEALATKVVPLLLPLSIETGLNEPQFDAFVKVIRDILQSIEQEQKKKFKLLSANSMPTLPTMPTLTNDLSKSSENLCKTELMNDVMETFNFSQNLDLLPTAAAEQPDVSINFDPFSTAAAKPTERSISFSNQTVPESPTTYLKLSERPTTALSSTATRRTSTTMRPDIKLDDEINRTMNMLTGALKKGSIPKTQHNNLLGATEPPIINFTKSRKNSQNNKTARDHLNDLLG